MFGVNEVAQKISISDRHLRTLLQKGEIKGTK